MSHATRLDRASYVRSNVSDQARPKTGRLQDRTIQVRQRKLGQLEQAELEECKPDRTSQARPNKPSQIEQARPDRAGHARSFRPSQIDQARPDRTGQVSPNRSSQACPKSCKSTTQPGQFSSLSLLTQVNPYCTQVQP